MQFKQILLIPVLVALTGCGATAARYQPVVDQPDQNYVADLGECQQLAETRSYTNDDVKTAAAVGAVAGALLGGLGDDGGWDDALGGALVGSAIGGGSEAWDMREERKNIVVQCLRGRGHLVAG